MKENVAFEVIEGWEKLPEGWSFVEVAGVATDSRDRVYAFNRGEHPMIVFDADGNFLDAWGEGLFTNAHGIHIGPDDRIYAADNFDHTVRMFSPDGTLLDTLRSDSQLCAQSRPGPARLRRATEIRPHQIDLASAPKQGTG